MIMILIVLLLVLSLFVSLKVTPMRNGLTLGSTNIEAGAFTLYKQVLQINT